MSTAQLAPTAEKKHSDEKHRAAAWVYRGVWRVLVRLFRVPSGPPQLPSGSAQGGTIERATAFRPSDGFLRYLKLQFWVLLVIVDLVLSGFWIALAVYKPMIGLLITPVAVTIIVLPDILAYIAIHLRYDTTWYLLSDRSLRIRRGIWTIHETTLTYQNIQNVRVVQGPLERWFGIANVIVETAGGGGGGAQHGAHGQHSAAHIGRIEGVDNAAEIRTLLMSRSAVAGDSGTGDHDDSGDQPTSDRTRGGWTKAHVAVLAEIAAALPARSSPESPATSSPP